MGLPYNISFKIKMLQQKYKFILYTTQMHHLNFFIFIYIYIYIYIAAARNQPAFNFKIKLLQ